MTYFADDDIPALLADTGVDLTFGSTTVKALRDEADEEMLEGLQGPGPKVGKAIMFTIQTSTLPGIAVNSQITAEGKTYRVRLRQQMGDGALTRLFCMEVS